MTNTEDLLAERGATHGDYAQHARVTQRLKAVIEEELKLCKGDLNGFIEGRARIAASEELTFIISESIDMILHKLGRIVAGDATHLDHWADIAGYAQLVANALHQHSTPTPLAASKVDVTPISARIRQATQGFEEEMTRSLK